MAGQQSAFPMTLFMQRADVAIKQATPPNRAELVRLIVLLFTAMRTCHEAYLRMKAADADALTMAEMTWRTSVHALMGVIETLETTLHIIAPDVFQGVVAYAHSEATLLHGYGDESLTYLMEIGRHGQLKTLEFQDALDHLGQFIREHFSMEEVFQATTSTSS